LGWEVLGGSEVVEVKKEEKGKGRNVVKRVLWIARIGVARVMILVL
jgi:hypothetical protein